MESQLYVPPWTILSGLGMLSRKEICNLVAAFEETTLLSVTTDKAADQLSKLRKRGDTEDTTAFARRLAAAADNLLSSDATDTALRVQLWYRLASALEVDTAIPFSTKSANRKCAAVSWKAAELAEPLAPSIEDIEGGSRIGRAWNRVRSVGKKGRTSDFSALVAASAEKIVAAMTALADADVLTTEQKAELEARIREHIGSLPPELQNAMRSAMSAGDGTALALLASGTSLLGVGVGVHLAGFSAYILAAQASAFIPLVSGPAVVSALFMVANPFFSIPVMVGGALFASHRFSGNQSSKLASETAIHLGLRGLAAGEGGLQAALKDFRALESADFNVLPASYRAACRSRHEAMGSFLAKHGRHAVPDSASGFESPQANLLDGLLSRGRGDLHETTAVGAMTAADMIYNVVSIDPTVMKAADFARTADISDIFQFGAFAERIAQMQERAGIGAESNLRGYVAEQIVAARLVENGHIVTLPELSNNPGFDVIVDGNRFQVKCLLDIDGLREHFEKYPDMPVYANGELAEAIIASGEEWASKVFYIDGFDRDIADLVMQASLDAGEALGDMNVPYFAMAASSARNLYMWWRGRIPLIDVPISIIVDNGIKGGLATVGGISGKLLGLAAFGPAGAFVLGGAVGVGALMGSGWTKEQVTRLLSAEWCTELDTRTERLRGALIREIGGKIAILEDRRRQTLETQNRHRFWLGGRFSDDILALREASHELETEIQVLQQPVRAARCFEFMAEMGVHPLNVQKEQTELLRTIATRPSTASASAKKALSLWGRMKPAWPQENTKNK